MAELKQDDKKLTKLEKEFLIASDNGEIEKVARCLEKGVNINIQGDYDRTALILASFAGRASVVRLLLENNADVNIQSGYRHTALTWASNMGHIEIVKKLLLAGADVNSQYGELDDNGTALSTASYNGHFEIVKLLLEHGADVDIKNKNGETALDSAKERLGKYMKFDHATEINKQQKIIELLENPPQKLDKQLSQIEWEDVYVI